MSEPLTPSSKERYADCPCCGYKGALSMVRTNGKDLYFCHVGCSQTDLRAALGKSTFEAESVPKSDYIQRLWNESLPAEGTPVAEYLRQRGLFESIPASIRYWRTLKHAPTKTSWPVMLAAVTDIDGNLQAVHRTWLRLDGSSKAPVEPAKMSLGPMQGFACHLAPAAAKMAIGEGLENSLTIMQVTGIPTWSGISAGGIRTLILPPLPLACEVVICADNDANGCGQKAAYDAARRWTGEDRQVKIALPPKPDEDFNDLLRGGAL